MPDREKVIRELKAARLFFEMGSNRADGVVGNLGCKSGMKYIDDALALLKEQEPKTGHWIFESRYCDAWSNICSECGRLMTTGAGVYANYCSNCGAKMTGGEMGWLGRLMLCTACMGHDRR